MGPPPPSPPVGHSEDFLGDAQAGFTISPVVTNDNIRLGALPSSSLSPGGIGLTPSVLMFYAIRTNEWRDFFGPETLRR